LGRILGDFPQIYLATLTAMVLLKYLNVFVFEDEAAWQEFRHCNVTV
jgi:hypothetical protein